MIKQNARLSICEIPLECIQVTQHEPRYVERLVFYVQLLQSHPDDYAGLLHVEPSHTHAGMFALLDGHHRFAASIIAGRDHALCLVVEDKAVVELSEKETARIRRLERQEVSG